MPRIVVYKGERPLKRLNFVGGTQRIGRLLQCEIAIEDVDIALEQALIERDGDRYFLKPLSFNPAINIDGKEIRTRAPLDDGVAISIGEYRLVFSTEADPPSDVSPADADHNVAGRDAGVEDQRQRVDTPIVASDSPEDRFAPPVRRFRSAEEIAAEFASARSDEQSEQGDRMVYCLIAITGPFEGELYDLHEGENFIGSGSECDARLGRDKEGRRYKSIAASHASLSVSGEILTLRAFKSQFGTACNGRLLLEGQMIMLGESDEIEIRHAPEGTIFRLATRGHLDISPPNFFEPAAYAERKIPLAMIVAMVLILLLIVVVILAYK